MSLLDKLKEKRKEAAEKKANIELYKISVETMEKKYEADDLVGAAKDLRALLEAFGKRKTPNHKYKGREFIHFLLSHKHKDLKNTGYKHWKNIIQIIQLNQSKVYPYHKSNLREAMTFFEKEIKGINNIVISLD